MKREREKDRDRLTDIHALQRGCEKREHKRIACVRERTLTNCHRDRNKEMRDR